MSDEKNVFDFHGLSDDEELERLEAKSASGDVLDPIALHDPVGQSVEKVVLRVGIAVVVVLVAGILLAQIACKNI